MRSLIIAILLIAGQSLSGGSTVVAYNSAVDALSVQARSHLEQGDVQRAELIAQRIVRIDPDDSRGWALMADIRKAQGNDYAASEYRARARVAGASSANGAQSQPSIEESVDTRTSEPATRVTEVVRDQVRAPEPVQHSEVDQASSLPEAQNGTEYNGQQERLYENEKEQSVVEIEQPTASGDSSASHDQRVVGVEGDRSRDPVYRSRNIIDSETGRVAEGAAEQERSSTTGDVALNRVFADSGAYSRSRTQTSSRTQPASRAQTSVPARREYNAEQRSRLDRIREGHRQQVARLQKKLFGRDRSHKTHRKQYRPKAELADRTARSDLMFSGGSNQHNRSTASLVPPGYYPSEGYCRIWYYDLAPDNQPPAGDCDRMREQLPVGARLLIGSDS